MRLRTVVCGVVVTPVLASVVLVGSAPAANAGEPKIGGGGDKTGRTARVTGNGGKVLGVARQARLMLRGHEVARGKGPISYTFSTHSVSNGTYEATLQTTGAGLLWATRAHTTLRVRSAPYVPSGVTAHRSGHSVTVRWRRGPEPDLTSYKVISSGGPDVRRSADDACSASSCVAKLRLPADGSGSYGFAVRAYRGSGSGGTVASAASNTRHVSLPTPKRARASAGPHKAPGRRHGGRGPSSPAYPATAAPGGGYLPRGLGGQSPYLPRSTTRSPFKLPSVGPSGFSYPTPDDPRVAPPAGGREHIAQPAPVAQESPIGVGVAAALAGLLVLAHLAARWRLRLVADRARTDADARAEAKALSRRDGGGRWSSASAWSRRAARGLKRVYHRDRRRH